MNEQNESSKIIDELERGDIDAAEAIRRLEAKPSEPPTAPADHGNTPARWSNFWMVPVSFGAIGLFGGYGLATVGGWWWLVAGPLSVIGAMLFITGLASIESPWVHLRIQSDERGSVSEFGLSVPLPLRPVIWLLERFGPYVSSLERTSIDELLLAMQAADQSESPIFIDVHEEGSGERIRVYLG